jgi:serine/threonine protein kinase
VSAHRGTIINFVERDAVVMELLEAGLPNFHQQRQRTFLDLFSAHSVLFPSLSSDKTPLDARSPEAAASHLRPATPQEIALAQKVALIEKTALMVQIAEAVAWLHGEQQIVHKDLAPDNIMLSFLSSKEDDKADWRGLSVGSLADALVNIATEPSFRAKIIDFGLSDQRSLSRNWYEEPLGVFATEKLAYLSLEARHRRRRIHQRLEINPESRQIVIPDSLRPDKAGELSIKVGDLLIDESDPRHYYTMEVTSVQQDPHDGRVFYATMNGEMPSDEHLRQFDLVHQLAEPHDIYALGAVFYFILTGDHTAVSKLTNIAGVLQDTPLPLQARTLATKHPQYLGLPRSLT